MNGKADGKTQSLLFYFCPLLFAFFLLLSPVRAQEQINLNTAPIEELMRLPYVGHTVANRILNDQFLDRLSATAANPIDD